MSGKNAHTLSLESVPNVARPIIITAKKDATRNRKRDRCDTTENVVMRERVQLAVSADIEQPTGGVIRPGGEGIAVREETCERSYQ